MPPMRTLALSLCIACALLLSACAAPSPTDPGRNPPTDAQGNPLPARYSGAENEMAGLVVGESTDADVIARFGETDADATTDGQQAGSVARALSYDGIFAVCTRTADGTFVLTQLTVLKPMDFAGPRGICVGMPVADVEALFPRETRAYEGERDDYLYVHRVDDGFAEGPQAFPPFGVIARGEEGEDAGSFFFVDTVRDTRAYAGGNAMCLSVSFQDGKATEVTISVGPYEE